MTSEKLFHRTAVVVYNPTKIRAAVLERFVELYADPRREICWVPTTKEDTALAGFATALTEDVDVVLVAGGDGTVRRIAHVLADTGIKMGIIPVGTGNLLARNLGLPLDPESAIRRAFTGEEHAVDLCEATVTRRDGSQETYGFTVMAGVGLDAQMVERTREELKRRIGPLAYIGGITRSLGGGNSVEATVTVDDHPSNRRRLHTMIFGNCGDLVNKIPLFPDALPDDGEIDVVAMSPRGLIGWLLIGLRIVFNTLRALLGGGWQGIPAPQMDYFKGHTISVSFAAPEVFEVDGDTIGSIEAATIRVIPQALVLMR